MPTTAPHGGQTITRAIRALKILASQSYEGVRLVDLATEMQLARPTAHRLLKSLMSEGMLVQDPHSRRYTLGPLVFELGLASAHQFNLHELCAPILEQLAEQTGDTAFLFVRSGNDAVCLSRVQGKYPIQAPSVPVGSRQPLGVSAGGLALLSSLSALEVDTIVRAIDPRLSVYGDLDAAEVHRLCAQTRRTGHAWISNRAVPGVSAVGLAVKSRNGTPVAAVAVSATLARMTEKRVREILPLLQHAAREITNIFRA
ncbi:IclR family transcriptional regulator [Polaromonas eurypsychrophila]|uniref:IclR family transcriptional regulator n=1 Tax=Polaromonas eurypsychrophila TaxID=1614635 RepID=A0A916WHJ1_9BURK|nr:IclR family transcriptional regulator [Polaromonas eurypsychrophila]GGA97718.1 IclR family transcriptional regulator [Polaromonas eurypsychrophila]